METDDVGIGKSEAAGTMSSFMAALDKAASLQQAHYLLDTNGFLDRWTAMRACIDNAAQPPLTHAQLFFEQTMEVDLRDVVSRSLYLFKAFELELSAFFMRNLRPGNVFFDVDAHFGYFSLLARHKVGQTGAVVAFEPLPSTAQRLADNVGMFDNIQVVRKAIWDEPRHLILNDFGPEYSAFTSVTGMRMVSLSKRSPPQPRAISAGLICGDRVQRRLPARRYCR